MKLSEFYFEHPSELIAQEALEPRDASRMMVLNRQTQTIFHSFFKTLPDYFEKGEVLVLNNTKVLPARLFAKKKTGGLVEVLFLNTRNPSQWNCMISPGKGLIKSSSLIFQTENIEAKVVEDFGKVKVLEFSPEVSVQNLMKKEGIAPLPPYIRREAPRAEDLHRYQSIFAKEEGAIAAPTASLHFTKEVFEALHRKGVEIYFITLHVGVGTFEPIQVENIADHVMQTEFYNISQTVAEGILRAKQEGRKITAVGTTVVRALESYFKNPPQPSFIKGGEKQNEFIPPLLKGDTGEFSSTNLFITPGYSFKIVDRFLTNFHQPCSTPLLLTSAFAGKDFLFQAYAEAIEKKYRLFSYGDCVLVL